jgi:hypothetical protein
VPILSGPSMPRPLIDQRFVLAVGDKVDSVAEEPGVTVIDGVDRVVLVEASDLATIRLRRAGLVDVYVFESEADARRAFALFLQ